jgi:hypothetical protein
VGELPPPKLLAASGVEHRRAGENLARAPDEGEPPEPARDRGGEGRHEREVDAARLSPGTKQTYIRHTTTFVRWLGDYFHARRTARDRRR